MRLTNLYVISSHSVPEALVVGSFSYQLVSCPEQSGVSPRWQTPRPPVNAGWVIRQGAAFGSQDRLSRGNAEAVRGLRALTAVSVGGVSCTSIVLTVRG